MNHSKLEEVKKMEVRKIHEVVTRQNIRAYAKILAEDVLKILDELEHREMQRDIVRCKEILRWQLSRCASK